MKNKQGIGYVLCLCIICLFSNNVKSQYAVAGMHGVAYVDITPDTFLNSVPNPNNTQYYFIDINQDGVNDVSIKENTVTTAGTQYYSAQISSLNSQTSFSFGSRDSTYFPAIPPCPAQWYARTILKKYNYGDTIKNGKYVTFGYLYYTQTSGPCMGATSAQWLHASNMCFGVRYHTLTDTVYGWVNVDVPTEYSTRIKEFSLGTPIFNSTDSDFSNIVSIFPNPANNTVEVSVGNSKIILVTICDMLGKEQINSTEKEIDVSSLQVGVYFVRVKTCDRMITKKINIQR